MAIEKMNKKDADTLSYYLAEQLYGWDGNVAESYFLAKMKDKDNICLVIRKGNKAVAGIVARVESYWDDKQVLIEMVIAREGEEEAGTELVRQIVERMRNKVKYVNMVIDSRLRRLVANLEQLNWENPTLVVMGNETFGLLG